MEGVGPLFCGDAKRLCEILLHEEVTRLQRMAVLAVERLHVVGEVLPRAADCLCERFAHGYAFGRMGRRPTEQFDPGAACRAPSTTLRSHAGCLASTPPAPSATCREARRPAGTRRRSLLLGTARCCQVSKLISRSVVDDNRPVSAEQIRVHRFDHGQGGRHRNGCVERVASVFEDFDPGDGRQFMGRAHHSHFRRGVRSNHDGIRAVVDACEFGRLTTPRAAREYDHSTQTDEQLQCEPHRTLLLVVAEPSADARRR